MQARAILVIPALAALLTAGCINVSENGGEPYRYTASDDFEVGDRRIVIEEPASDRTRAAATMEVLLDDVRAAGCKTISAQSWRGLGDTDQRGIRVVASCPATAKLVAR